MTQASRLGAVRLLVVIVSVGIGLVILTAVPATAVTLVTESFTGTSTPSGQFVSGGSSGACLTAATVSAPGSIPACPGGPFDVPTQGALRLTSNGALQTGFAIFTQTISAGSGLLVDLDQFQYNNPLGTPGADGISFFLVDGSASPTQPGGFGAGLGYAPISGNPGIVGGYIGVGFDDFGNYSVPLSAGDPAPGFSPNTVALRGAEAAGYRYVTGRTLLPSQQLAGDPETNRNFARKRVQVSISTENVLIVRMNFFDGAGLVPVLGPLDLDSIPGQPSFPSTFKLGFAASSGPNNVNIHEIQNLTVSTIPPDLRLSKTHTGTFVAGQAGSYTLTVSNNDAAGPTTSTVTVTDTLPAGLTPTGASGAGWSCGTSGQTVTCTRSGSGGDALAAAASYPPITLPVNVALDAPASVTNSASVATADEGNVADNAASDPTPITRFADLQVTTSVTPDPVPLGQTVTYTVVVTNNGPVTATGVRVRDEFPLGDSFGSAQSSRGSCAQSGRTVECTIGTMAAGEVVTITIVNTAVSAGTEINLAAVFGNEPDPNTDNNGASVSTTAVARADLSLTKTQSATTVLVGESLIYTLTATNNGPSPATGVVVTDTLPASLSLISATTSQGSCGGTTTITCALGTLANAASATITIVGRATENGLLANVADVEAAETDPNLQNNRASTGATVGPPLGADEPRADLSIAKAATRATGRVGEPFTYQLIVTNNGPNRATGVNVTENLPQGVALISASPGSGSCSGTRTVTCAIGDLEVGARSTITVVVVASVAGTFTNAATVIATEADPNPTNNVAAVSATATAEADLAIIKTESPDPVAVGSALTYRLLIRNNGPASATGVRVHDELPASNSFVSAVPGQGTCQHTAGTVDCAVGTLGAGGSVSVTIVTRPLVAGTEVNLASVAANEADPNPANNGADVGSTVVPEGTTLQADTAVTQRASDGTVSTGGTVTITVTITNNGPSPATAVRLFDSIPAGATFVSATPSQGACEGIDIVLCSLDTLASGASASVSLVLRAGSAGSISNVASVLSNETDPNPVNNESTVRVEVAGGLAPTPTPGGPPTPTPTSGPAPTSTPVVVTSNDDDEEEKDERQRLTEEQRQQRERTNASSLDDERTEGNVIAVRCETGTPGSAAAYFDDGIDAPYAIIVNRDGPQKVRLLGDTKTQCRSITVGSYLEVSGVKQTEQLFDADSVTIRRLR